VFFVARDDKLLRKVWGMLSFRRVRALVQILAAATCAGLLAMFATSSVAQTRGATPPMADTAMNNLDAMFQYGGEMNLHTMEEWDRTSREQAETRSSATLSRLDLKAPRRARQDYFKGLQLFARNEYQSAVDSLVAAVSAYPDFVSAHNALGCSYLALKQNDLARQEFARAVELDDHLSSSYVNLGRAELALGHGAEAEASVEKASAIAPLDANLLLALAYIQYSNHNYSSVVKTAQRAHAEKHTGAATVHYFAAAAWQAQGHLAETQGELQTFLAENPNSGYAEQARQVMREIKAKLESPSTPASDSNAPWVASQRSYRGEKVLQDIREKQQIAEAETEGTECSTCGPAGPRPPTDTTVANAGGTRNDSRVPDSGSWVLHSRVDEVMLFFSATDHGKSVTNLTQHDVTVRDDQRPPETIFGFRSEASLPLRMGLLIDTSTSITDRFAFEQAAAANFLRHVLTGSKDVAFVAGFSNSPVLVQDFTGNLDQISRSIGKLVPVGGTAIWDAVGFAADKLAETKEDQPIARVLVVISDGEDNSSSVTLKRAIERAEKDEVIVYTVSTHVPDPQIEPDSPGNHALKVLAELTGGAAFFPGSAGDLNRSLGELEQVIRSRYLISYKPAQFQRDGRYRSIAITAEKGGHKLKVNARKGYYPASTSADAR
jgi:Ca-activated chloride channel homolog